MDILNKEYSSLKEVAAKYKEKYQSNDPFPNIYFDDFFNPELLDKVLAEFPDISKLEGNIHYGNPNEEKFATKGSDPFGPNTKILTDFMNSQEFRDFLNELTGIQEPLLADPTFEGGGFHEIKPGGYLKVHVDFHKHRDMDMDRRLNLLVYLNKDWKEEYGGHFELWEKDMSKCVVKVAPLFNRLAMFSTTGYSWHGHPDPLACPEGRSRKSLALYYYSDGRPEEELSKKDRGRITTTFAERKGIDSPAMRRYNTMVNVANRVLPDPVIRFIKSFTNK